MVRHDGRRDEAPGLVLNGAVSQYERWVQPGVPRRAPVDDRSFEQLLAFAPRFGELVRFYDLAGRVDGDWEDFFLADSLMVLASMAADDPAGDEAAYRELLRRARRQRGAEERWELLGEGFRRVAARARRMDGWLRGLLEGAERRGARPLHRQLRALVDGEAGAAARRVAGWDRAAAGQGGEASGIDWDAFQPVWKLGRVRPDEATYGDGPPAARALRVLERLGEPLEVLLDASLLLRPDARDGLEGLGDDLAAGDLRPQLALYVAFARLFGHAQDTVNRFSSRLRRFYYRAVLREPEHGPRPDQVFLAFTLADAEGVTAATVPAGTLYPAGEDEDGEEILFVSRRELAVSATEVADLRMLRRVDGPLLLPAAAGGGGELEETETGATGSGESGSAETGARRAVDGPAGELEAAAIVPRRVLATRVAAATPGEEIAAADAPGWPTFGAATTTGASGSSGAADGAATVTASLGFAVASPYLLLTGGDRVFALVLSLADDDVLDRRLEALAAATGLSAGEAFLQVLAAAFRLFVSTPGGWFPVDRYSAKQVRQQGAPAWRLAVHLPPNVPPLVPLGEEVEAAPGQELGEGEVSELPAVTATNPAPGLPTVKAYLVQQPVTVAGEDGSVRVYPYSLLERARLEEVGILTSVDGLADLRLRNTDGEVDPTAPFPVFGGVPQRGSWLELASPELFAKVPQEVDVTVRWLGLPPNDTGFLGWYRDYRLGLDGEPPPDGGPLFDNATFGGTFTLRDPGPWTLQPGGGDACQGEGAGSGSGQRVEPGAGSGAARQVATGRRLDGGPPRGGDPAAAATADAPSGRRVCLFRAGSDCASPPPDLTLCAESTFSFTAAAGELAGHTPPPYYRPADSALRLELSSPSYAFGNDLYPINVLDSVVRDLPSGESCGEKCLELCQPLQDASIRMMVCITQCGEEAGGGDGGGEVSGDVGGVSCMTCVDLLVDRLLLSAVATFLRCLRRGGAGLDPSIPQVLETRVRGCTALPRRERLRCLRQCREEARELLGEGSGWSCFEIFDALVVALLCIELALHRCRTTEGTVDPACLAKALAECKAGLDTAYAACLQGCAEDCMQPPVDLRYPNPPYLPQAESVSVSYTARCTVDLEEGCGTLFQLTAFNGYRALGSGSPPLLEPVAEQGSLLLGLAPYARARALDFLVRMATEGDGADPGGEPVTWSWLAADGWRELPANALLADGTGGLRGTGIVALDLPALPVPTAAQRDRERLLPRGLFWLRAAVEAQAGRFPRTVSIRPHALVATRQMAAEEATADASANGDLPALAASAGAIPGDGEPSAAANPAPPVFEPLPAGTITSAVQDLPDVGSIVQPLPSFGGRPAEGHRGYRLRLAERLRHKDRAIQPWDHERLVLERFPEVWKVAAVPALGGDGLPAPGQVLVVVVAGELGNESADPTVPRLRSELLGRIRGYLEERASPFVTLTVANPVYVRLKATARVVFRSPAATDGDDEPSPAAPAERLDRDLVAWLSPWFYDAAREARRGRYASQADVAEFIRGRPYVESLVGLELAADRDVEKLPWYFLTSARQHDVRAVSGGGGGCGTDGETPRGDDHGW